MKTAAQRLALALRISLRSASFAAVMTTLTLAKTASAQREEPAPAISVPAVDPDAAQLDVAAEEDPPQADAAQDSASDTDYNDPDLVEFVTGLPYKYLLTPFHWGPISLISLTAFEGYNSNPQYQSVPVGASITSVSALALYATKFAGWQANLQYEPFIWLSSIRTIKDFSAASGDIRTLRRLNGSWHWTLGDRLRYAPTHSTEQERGFVYDPGSGFTVGNAFLSSGRNVFLNGIAATLTDSYTQSSTLTFHAHQDYTRLSTYLGGQSSGDIPTQDSLTFSAGVTWRDHLSLKDTISAEYNYRWLTSSGTSLANVDSHAASVGWSHKFAPSFGVSATAGPAWSISAGQERTNSPSRTRTTVHGSLALSKEFHKGGVILSFARSDSFSGIISDGFHNRYDLNVHRQFSTHFNCSATGSYVQQEILNTRNTSGELATAEARYLVSRNWSVFSQVRYLHIIGNERIVAPEKSVVVGLRWFWVPEKE